VEAISKNPLARAVRLDKMTFAALEATLRLYRDPELAMKRIPTLRMARASLKVMREKARRLSVAIQKELTGDSAEVSITTTAAQIGGGALPLMELPSAAVSIRPGRISVNDLDIALHTSAIPVIGRIEDDRYLIDVRTLLDGETKIVQNEVCDAIRGK
jgi:L-seryl-tRNA(Ser) seleniumtransferase